MKLRLTILLSVLLVLALVIAACADDDEPEDAEDATADQPEEPEEPEEPDEAQDPADDVTVDWLDGPFLLVTPSGVGGSLDRLLRGTAPFLSEELGVPVNVENWDGGQQQIGTLRMLEEGGECTAMMYSASNPYWSLMMHLRGADFTHDDMAMINAQWRDTNMLVTPLDRPWDTFEEFIDDLEVDPGDIVAGVDVGSSGHLGLLVLLDYVGLSEDDLGVILFESAGDERAALASGTQNDFGISATDGMAAIEGEFKGLVLFDTERHRHYDDVPTIHEVSDEEFVDMPIASGTNRINWVPAECRDNHPDRYEIIVDAYQRMLDNPEYQEWLEENVMVGDWIGPERTREIADAQDAIVVQFLDLFAD